ncbi:aspartyl protease family protein [Brevundimonas sp. 2YAF1]|uniref:aspartyl protease family protein n=1 Tax=Brevundimonas sp. 2YAF1 TaxID=3233024 RepID=UPI003F8EE6DF
MKIHAFALSAAALLAATATASAETPPSPEELLQRHAAWRGGPAFEGLTGLHQTGVVTTTGLQGVAQWWIAAGPDGVRRARQASELGPVHEETGATEGDAWSRTMSGQIETLSRLQAEDELNGAALMLGLLPRGARSIVGQAEMLDGRACAPVAADAGRRRYELLIEVSSGVLCGVRASSPGKSRTTLYSDWRWVDGVRLPFRHAVDDSDDNQDGQIVIDSLSLNPTLDAATFSRPEAARVVRFDPGRTDSGWVDFELFSQRRIFIPVSVQGRPVEAMLDSGAEVTVVDRAFAESIGLIAQGGVTAIGTGGTETVSIAPGFDVRFGEATLKGMTVAVMDLSAIAQALGRPVPVLLGKELMNQSITDIDFAAGRIRLVSAEGFAPPPGTVELPLTPVEGLRAVPITIEDGPPVLAMFDLGNGSALSLYPGYAAEARLLEGRRVSAAMAGGVGGAAPSALVSLSRISIGGYVFANVPATLRTSGGVWARDDAAANIGLPIFSRFRLMIDFGGDRLFLLPGQNMSAPLARNRSGLNTVISNGKRVVRYVAPGSPAEAGAWKAGDVIVDIDGQGIDPENHWGEAAAGRTVTLTLEGGERRQLTLADYF